MAGMGAGYDLSTSTFSPDGRVFQVEYASKAVDNSGTALALVCKDGIVCGVEKFVLNKMLLRGSTTRTFAVDKHVGIVVSGLLPDARQVVQRARAEANQYRRIFGHSISPKVLADRVGMFVHAYTLYWSVRPFGASILIAAFDPDTGVIANGEGGVEGEIYCVEPSGICYKYFGNAIGKGKQNAKTEIEKLDLKNLSCKDALFHIAKIIHGVHDESKDKKMEIEMSWICPQSNNVFDFVPREEIDDAENRAIKFLEDLDTA